MVLQVKQMYSDYLCKSNLDRNQENLLASERENYRIANWILPEQPCYLSLFY